MVKQDKCVICEHISISFWKKRHLWFKHRQKIKSRWICKNCYLKYGKSKAKTLIIQRMDAGIISSEGPFEKVKWECGVCKKKFKNHEEYLIHHHADGDQS